MRRIIPLAALAAVACTQAPELAGIRDVRPSSVEIGEKLLIETDPDKPLLAAGQTVKVTLHGWKAAPGKKPESDWTLTLPGRATAPAGNKGSNRVLVDADEHLRDQLGGHVEFVGKMTVEGIDVNGQPAAYVTGNGFRLNFFPRSVRRLAYGLVGDKERDDLLEWLGIDVKPEQVKLDNGQMRTLGLRVDYVRDAFNIVQFVAENDCGRWSLKDKACKGGPDAKVHRDELLQGKPEADHPRLLRLFAEISGEKDPKPETAVSRTDSELHTRDASPAAAAGLRRGDLIGAAFVKPGKPVAGTDGASCDPADACLPIHSKEALAQLWKMEGEPTVALLVSPGEQGAAPATISLPRYGKPASIPSGFLLGGILFVVGMLVILPVPIIGGLIVVWERKIAGRMQSRPGPNRVGPNGWLQFLADGIKLIVKEDLIPAEADPYLFRVSPYLVFIGVFATFVVLPFSQSIIVADLNVGILYLLSVTSLVVVGIIMGGWASNSKWSLLGGMRSAAQIISYELPASIAVLSVVTLSGTLSTQGLVLDQGGMPWRWHLFDNPFTFACFFIYFISALAEGNRTPFDLPEAESELVAGYNTEYSGFRFSIYFLAEWVNLIVIGAVATTVFLGGWRIPGLSAAAVESGSVNLWLFHLPWQFVAFMVFSIKVVLLIFVIIWVRWTLPRFRVDQMMNMCWKYFLPISLVSFIGTSAWVVIAPRGTWLRTGMQLTMFAIFGLGTLIYFLSRVQYVRKTTKVLELRGQ